MKCPHCNAENSEFNYKCVQCGKELASSPNVYKTDREYESPINKGDLYTENDYESPAEQDKQNSASNYIPPSKKEQIHTDKNSSIEEDWKDTEKAVQKQMEEITESFKSNERTKTNPAQATFIKFLFAHIVLLFVFTPLSIVPFIGIIFSIKGIVEVNNGDEEKYKKTLEKSKILILFAILAGIILKTVQFIILAAD